MFSNVDRVTHRLAFDLEEIERRVDLFESPRALQQWVSDHERQVARLQGHLDLLGRMQPPVALPPAIVHPSVIPHPAVEQAPAPSVAKSVKHWSQSRWRTVNPVIRLL
ncbi:hypothetical protein P3T76_003656 [Phytophthora citrophthora]|uniref:Uncharacterized protein n=1 Tax=Phytophthora citrophthora TaxID=4793 RepID=A0AAD9GW17_9STRA|nr:hypothetical protein P3T76_003656 [Phytophthora citrophthora]